ncbi:MAG: sporulation transcription factor Spo0A [Clostridia bacterium]|nr:sporulation transcription factor Spo0A [Clostridia bacterium]
MAIASVFLIQEDETALNSLMKAIDTQKFKIIGSSLNGLDGVQKILKLSPDLVITSITLAGIDGLEVCERVKLNAPNVKTVILSSIVSDDIIRSAISKGAVYYLVKPVESSLINARLQELFGGIAQAKVHNATLEERISKIFISVGIPPHIKGYSYLREGVKMAIDRPAIINSITKELYPKIGEKYETTPSKVERAIRHAIEVAWNRGRIDSINNLFGVRAYVGSEKPTNGEFIALVADKMLLEGA